LVGMQFRLVIVLLIVVALTTIPSSAYVQAFQPTTSLVALNYYTNAAVDSMITVSFDVSYSANQKVWLMTAISCDTNESNCSSISMNGVDSTPFQCNSVNPFSDQQPLISGMCYLTVSSTGSDFFSYNLSFNKTGTYDLTASSQLNYPGNSTNISGSQSVSQTMTIKVTGP
jgi:hypothetical protein